MPKTIKIQGTFEVLDPNTQNTDGKQVIRDSEEFPCVTTLHPTKVPGNSTNYQINFGGVTLAKRIFLRCDFEVTVKLNSNTEDGFKLLGDMIVMNESGISALFVNTGPNETEFTAVIAGD